MSKDTGKTQIVLDDVEYIYEDMTPEQKLLVNHIQDLTRKIGEMSFSLDQLKVGKEAFFKMLKSSLDNT
jgi:hypothetical protein